MDTSQYIDVFIEESAEHLEVLYNELLALEKNPTEKSIIEEIFRAAHTLKGMAATMGYSDLAAITHHLENVFDGIRYDRMTVQPTMVDVLFETVDHLNEIVEDIASGGDGKKNVTQIVQSLTEIDQGSSEPPISAQTEIAATTTTEASLHYIKEMDEFELTILKESSERNYTNYEIHVRLSEHCLLKGARTFMVFEVLEQLGEVIKSEPTVNELEEEQFDDSFTVLLVSKQSTEEIKNKIMKVSEIEQVDVQSFSVEAYIAHRNEKEQTLDPINESSPQASNEVTTAKKKAVTRKTIRVNIERLDGLMNLFEELVIDRARLETISDELGHSDLQETVERMTRVSGDLQNIILNMRMVPIDQVFNRFPRMIRQLARDLKKEVVVEIVGADTELDRTVIDEIGDPLVHLIRNAMDHGIELPEERINKGKREQGTIKLQAYHSGNYVIIEISDDGAGIHKEKVVQKALSNGIISEHESNLLSDQQIYELIMASGFSTTDSISEVSGRGVGLDVVKNTIETLGGSISIDAKAGEGSTFSIQLPLTLSIISVLLIELAEEKYAVPLSSIIETTIIHKKEILSAHNKKVIDFRGHVVPLVFLDNVFDVSRHGNDSSDDYVSIVVVKKGEKLAGLVVDSFIGQQEVVLKSLGTYLTNTYAISGATILGDGEVALIIDSNAFIQ